MKKVLVGIICFMIGISTVLASEQYYIPQRNTYYQRSQHTYSFNKSNGEYHDEYAVSIYTLLKNLEEAKNKDIWTFKDKYEVPWNISNTSYALAYCADLDFNIVEEVPYNLVRIGDSKYIANDIKKNLMGIISNSYPFISLEEMKDKLLKAEVLTTVKVGDKEILTSKNNIGVIENYDPTRLEEIKDITMDEFVSGVQMAIYHYTNPNQIQEAYFNTLRLSSRTVLRSNDLWSNTYNKGKYDLVKNNIYDIRDYLIAQVGEVSNNLAITEVEASKIKSGYKLFVKFNRKILDVSDLKIQVYEEDNLIKEESFNLLNDNNVKEIEIGKDIDIKKIKIKVSGKEYLSNDVVIYEAEEKKDSSQTLIGMISDLVDVEDSFEERIKIIDEVNNPQTGNIILYSFIVSMGLLGVFVILKVYKKNKIFKI